MGEQRDEMTLTGTGSISHLPYGFVPVEIYYEKSNLPPLTIVEGDYQTRGYQVTFFNSAGEEIVHTETQFARCYAVNPKVSGDSYYTEGRYQDGHWYLWVPSKTLTVAGTVQIQIILYQGDQQLIHTRVCKVRISPSIAQNAIANPDDGEAGPLPKAVLESIQKMIKGSIDEEVRPLKEELSKFATKEEVSEFATKKEVSGLATKDHIHEEYQTHDQVKSQIDQKFILCDSLDDAKSKQESQLYPVGTIFLIKKEEDTTGPLIYREVKPFPKLSAYVESLEKEFNPGFFLDGRVDSRIDEDYLKHPNLNHKILHKNGSLLPIESVFEIVPGVVTIACALKSSLCMFKLSICCPGEQDQDLGSVTFRRHMWTWEFGTIPTNISIREKMIQKIVEFFFQ